MGQTNIQLQTDRRLRCTLFILIKFTQVNITVQYFSEYISQYGLREFSKFPKTQCTLNKFQKYKLFETGNDNFILFNQIHKLACNTERDWPALIEQSIISLAAQKILDIDIPSNQCVLTPCRSVKYPFLQQNLWHLLSNRTMKINGQRVKREYSLRVRTKSFVYLPEDSVSL